MKSEFSGILLEWYRLNKRELPWRISKDPYRVWLSEVILQQTRVAQGLAYFHRFTETFPTVQALAQAKEKEVLKLWQGLGYYSRARNMLHTAQYITSQLQGQFPQSAAELLGLKGVGPYTAAAIASICFGEAIPVVDGNVMRLISRFFGITQAVDQPAGRNLIDKILQQTIPRSEPGDFNQAMMEFGALQCTPAKPDCSNCPLAGGCFALQHNRVPFLPVKTPKSPPSALFIYFFRISTSDHTWIRQRDNKGIWRNLYEYPSWESPSPISYAEAAQAIGLPQGLVLSWNGETFKHLLTHRAITAMVLDAIWTPKTEMPKDWMKIGKNTIDSFPVSKLMEHILDKAN